MPTPVERVQTGLRLEKRTLKVLKALAEYLDLSLGDLLEGIVLHAFEGHTPFGATSLGQIGRLKKVYGLTLTAADSHVLIESGPPRRVKLAGRRVGTRAGTRASAKTRSGRRLELANRNRRAADRT